MKLTDIQTQLIAALRSGKFIRGTGYLCQRQGSIDLYCVLGVACEVLRLSRMPTPDCTADGLSYNYIFEKWPRFITNKSELEQNAYEKLGLAGAYGPVLPDYHDEAMEALSLDPDIFDPDEIGLTWLSDHGWTFNQIADLLETHPEWFFTHDNN